jgi:hypothetical protein
MSPAPFRRSLLFAWSPVGAARLLMMVVLSVACLHAEAARAEEAPANAPAVPEAPGAGQQRIALVRAEEAESADLDALDRELLRALAGREDLPAAELSPVPFSELALMVECQRGTADCLQLVARRLEHRWLVLRIVEHDSSGNSRLTLMAPDPFVAGVTRHVSGALSSLASSPEELARLLSQLYPRNTVQPVPLAPLAAATLFPATKGAQPSAPERAGRRRRLAGYGLLGTSVALLVSGSIVAGVAVRDRHRYEAQALQTAADVDRAAGLKERYEDRTAWARGLWAGAAVSGALGASLVFWDWLADRKDSRASGMRLAATPVAGGAGIWLSGALPGGVQ